MKRKTNISSTDIPLKQGLRLLWSKEDQKYYSSTDIPLKQGLELTRQLVG